MTFKTLLLAGAAFAAATTAQAQQAASSPGNWRDAPSTVDDVVVTREREDYSAPTASVSRSGVPLIEVPQSIQVLTRRLLDEQDLSTPADALANVSGVIPARPQEAVLADYTIRGFVSEMYIDGLPAYGCTAVADPASLNGFERIEVAKGPTATLYGGGLGSPVGGVINMVSKDPTGERKGCLEVRGGSFDTFNPRFDIDQPLTDTLAVRLAGEYVSGGEFVDAIETDRVAINPSIRWQATPDTEVILRGTYTDITQLEYSGLQTAVLGLPGVDLYRFTSTTRAPRTTNLNQMVTAVVNHRFSDVLSGQIQARHYENEFREYGAFTFTGWFPPVSPTAYPIITGYLPTDVREDTVDANLTARFTTGKVRHVVLGGLQYDKTRYDATLGVGMPIGVVDYAVPGSGYDLDFGPIPDPQIEQHDDYSTVAAYVQDQLTIGEKLHILASLRWTQIHVDSFGYDRKMEKVTPRIGVSYELTKGLAVFAGYAEGFRGVENFIPSPGQTPRPETSQSYEAGFKFDLANGLSGTVAAYQLTRQNVPTQDPNFLGGTIQTGEQESKGVELDLIFEPSENWSVLAAYAYTDAELTKDNSFPVGSRIPRVPDNRGRVAARYRVTEGALAGLGVGAGVSWSDGAEVTLPASYVTDSYTTVDAQVSYEFGPWKVGLSGVNLLDETYVLPYQYLAQSVIIPGSGRGAFLSLTFCY